MKTKKILAAEKFMKNFHTEVQKTVEVGHNLQDARLIILLGLIYNLKIETESILQCLNEIKIAFQEVTQNESS